MKKEPLGSFFYCVRGFTFMELMMVLAIVTVLAAVAIPRLWSSAFDEAKFADETIAALRYAQRTALAYQRTVCVNFTPTTLVLRYASAYGSGACDTDLLPPTGGTVAYTVSAPSAATVYTSAASFTFDRQGKPSVGQTIAMTGGGAATVEAESGYVH